MFPARGLGWDSTQCPSGEEGRLDPVSISGDVEPS